MCYQGKCFGCIPVEHGCLVLAIISAVANGIVLLGCIITGILLAVGIITAANSSHDFHDMDIDPEIRDNAVAVVAILGIAAGFLVIILGVASLIAFIFSVLLCNGICNRRPGQVKSYFIYGVVITVLTVLAATIQMVTDKDPSPGITAMVGSAIYSLFLVLVHQTYTKLCAGRVFKDHIRLVEDAY